MSVTPAMGCSGQKSHAGTFPYCFRRGMAFGWGSLGSERLYARKLWAGFKEKKLRWHVCRANFAQNVFLSFEFSYEKCSELFRGPEEIPQNSRQISLASKCSATLASVAAPPPGARRGFRGPNYPRHPTGGSGGWGATGPFEGCVAATLLRHTRNCGKKPRRGCSYTLECEGGGGW